MKTSIRFAEEFFLYLVLLKTWSVPYYIFHSRRDDNKTRRQQNKFLEAFVFQALVLKNASVCTGGVSTRYEDSPLSLVFLDFVSHLA